MIVTDLGEEGKRADALGKLGLSYGVGMVIGPFLGISHQVFQVQRWAKIKSTGGEVLVFFL